MKLQIVLEEMYKITEEMHSCIHSYDLETPFLKGKYLCYGKLYDSVDEIKMEKREKFDGQGTYMMPKKPDNLFELDFRNKYVDREIVLHIKEYINERINLFIRNNQDGDVQTLFLGCVFNLYYSIGLFDRCGILDLREVIDSIADKKTREYVVAMEKIVLQQLYHSFWSWCDRKMFSDEGVNEYLQLYLNTRNEEYLERIKESINPNFEVAKGFVEEYVKEWNRFSELKNENYSLEMLQQICPEYQYANLLLSIYSLESYFQSKGEKNEFTKYAKILDERIFDISVGVKKPSSLKVSIEDGKLQTIHPESFSRFGFGLPYVEFISKNEYYESLKLIDDYEISYEDMRKCVAICYPYEIKSDKVEMIVCSLKLAYNLDKSKESELKAKEEKKKVIKQFSHTYMNMRATSLYNIATELLKNEDKQYRNYGRKLLYEYSVKQNLTKDVEMLKLRFEDNIEDLYEIIANSILTAENEGVRIGDLIDDAIIRCMVTLVHDGSTSAKRLREKFENYDWISIRNNFENDILLSDNRDVKKWFNCNMFSINIAIGNDWEKIIFEKDSYAALLFVDILSELLINIFKYADKSELVELEFTNLGDEFMILSARNRIGKYGEMKEESGYGLQSEAEIIKIINEVNGKKVDPLKVKSSNGEFEVQFRISKNLFLKGGNRNGI